MDSEVASESQTIGLLPRPENRVKSDR